MEPFEDDIEVRRAVINDANEALRLRLSGRTLPALRPVAGELQRLVLQRLDPVSLAAEEGR
jgi:hypothetical protein